MKKPKNSFGKSMSEIAVFSMSPWGLHKDLYITKLPCHVAFASRRYSSMWIIFPSMAFLTRPRAQLNTRNKTNCPDEYICSEVMLLLSVKNLFNQETFCTNPVLKYCSFPKLRGCTRGSSKETAAVGSHELNFCSKFGTIFVH